MKKVFLSTILLGFSITCQLNAQDLAKNLLVPSPGFNGNCMGDVKAARVFPGKDAGAGGGTNTRGGVGIRKPHAFFCEPVYVGCFIVGAPVAGHIGVAHIVYHEKDDVRSLQFVLAASA